jgi:hypothetical protein
LVFCVLLDLTSVNGGDDGRVKREVDGVEDVEVEVVEDRDEEELEDVLEEGELMEEEVDTGRDCPNFTAKFPLFQMEVGVCDELATMDEFDMDVDVGIGIDGIDRVAPIEREYNFCDPICDCT